MPSINKEASESLKVVFRDELKKYLKLKEKIKVLSNEKIGLLEGLRIMLSTLKTLQEQDSSISLDDLEIPIELKLDMKSQPTIGDFVELILMSFDASLTLQEILEQLRSFNIPISEKNARVVLFNAITRDAQKRFKITKDKKVVLTHGK
jgi:hypothetical protein